MPAAGTQRVAGPTRPAHPLPSTTPPYAHPPFGQGPVPVVFDATRRGRRQAGTVGAVVVAAFSALVASSFDSNARDASGEPMLGLTLVAMLAGLGIAGLLVWRRNQPVRVCLVASAAAVILPLDSFAALLSLTWVIASAPRRTAWLCGAATTAATAIALGRDALRDPAYMVMSSTSSATGQLSYLTTEGFWVIGALCVAVAVGVGLARRWQRVAAAAVADKDAQSATTNQLRDKMTRQEERDLIAREVHDTVAHHISLISLQASALEVDRAASSAEVRAATQQMRTSAQQALAEMRGLVATLRTGADDDHSPGATLEDLAGLLDNARLHGSWVASAVYVADAHLAAPALNRAAFRIVQESLTNALKHAPGHPVEVDVRAGRQIGVTIRVANPLGSLDRPPPARSGSGILGMRERAERVGGWLDVQVDGGWHTVTAHLPWAQAD
ncbi:histidine kinase [Cellulomonas cellasea]|uniref:sensor histidine kinase n=1 Tax=Cellulomonas cellasea TaxID=43670 RepID=UPI0025A3E424|nr:histidine kinase [Cellulomonas cellasea]MDM8086134.1 histidine kinase [Cellulomonas cellasea]